MLVINSIWEMCIHIHMICKGQRELGLLKKPVRGSLQDHKNCKVMNVSWQVFSVITSTVTFPMASQAAEGYITIDITTSSGKQLSCKLKGF